MEGFGTIEFLYEECSPDLLAFLYTKVVHKRAQAKMDDLVIGRHANHADKKAMDKIMKQLNKALGNDDRITAEKLIKGMQGFHSAK